MADSFIPRKNPTSTDQKIDTQQVTHGGNDVQRERVLLVDGASADPIEAGVSGSDGGANNALNVTRVPCASDLSQSAVSVATTQTLLAAANGSRRELRVANVGSATVYYGKTGVTTATGQPIAPGQTLFEDTYNGALYGIVASGTVAVRVMEVTK